ncbi:hypothetical protein KIN20_029575 [Parelaphostrongylus tenuis]|uniref:Uncharacterized protein n=1 Tax=Parelaphostrongylus tenuis TaxID=148309 RepID=A0AAD5R2P9_PARTN|nr:hypothetical protein KIN20_029575 [Parelaphostrongylus tenuis]
MTTRILQYEEQKGGHVKMELTSEQIRMLMMHEWLLLSNATVASERINLAWGEDTVGKVCRFHANMTSPKPLKKEKLPERNTEPVYVVILTKPQ